MNIIEQSNEWKAKADKLLDEKGLIKILSEFGEIHFTGAYSYNLMMHGDIDISVVRENPYTTEEVMKIFETLYYNGNFRSYFISGDWDDPRKGAEFPDGKYVGLKEKINGERWKVDLWFISANEFAKRENESDGLALINLSEEKRKLILECKKFRNENKLEIAGKQIYDLVIGEKIKESSEIRNFI